MGTKRDGCDKPIIPTRPPKGLCISNGDGTCEKWNTVTQKNERELDINYVCKNVSDYMREQEWIDDVLRSIDQ